jgi:hypothetical protein
LHDGRYEEVDVGIALKLQQKGKGQKREDVVLSGRDVVGSKLVFASRWELQGVGESTIGGLRLHIISLGPSYQ